MVVVLLGQSAGQLVVVSPESHTALPHTEEDLHMLVAESHTCPEGHVVVVVVVVVVVPQSVGHVADVSEPLHA